jgi:DNA repair exonuclease SbcCD ATPase subunit
MLPNRLKYVVFLLIAALLVVTVLIQRRVIDQLTTENAALRGNTQALADLGKQNEVLLKRLAQASTPEPAPKDQTLELLRLRGEVGILRRQVQELESLTNNSAAHRKLLRDMYDEHDRTLAQDMYSNLKAILDALGPPPDTGGSVQARFWEPQLLARAITWSRVHDALLSRLLEQSADAEQKLRSLEQDSGPEAPGIEDIRNEAAHLRSEIGERCAGVLESLSTKMESLKASPENFQR